MGSCLKCSWEKPWVFRERAPCAPPFFQLCLKIKQNLIILKSGYMEDNNFALKTVYSSIGC